MNLAICEDDSTQLTDIKEKCNCALKGLGVFSALIIFTYRSGEELIRSLNTPSCPKYDIIIMDIDFGEHTMNGIEATKALREMKIDVPVVITTSHDIYWRQGYGLDIVRYLSKPVTQEEISEALAECLKRTAALSGKEILLKNGTESIAVKYHDILYFECCAHTVVAHTKTKKQYTGNVPISKIEEQMPKQYFMKIHKGLLVNFNYVCCIKEFDMTLDDRTVLPIAQRRRSRCMDFFREHIKGNI